MRKSKEDLIDSNCRLADLLAVKECAIGDRDKTIKELEKKLKTRKKFTSAVHVQELWSLYDRAIESYGIMEAVEILNQIKKASKKEK